MTCRVNSIERLSSHHVRHPCGLKNLPAAPENAATNGKIDVPEDEIADELGYEIVHHRLEHYGRKSRKS
ncbi:hypothetical protein [Nitratireductor basaltis]|uniref:Manganese uptake regulator, Fur family n=1 Tax=Nitratireductor basaltis TaxID=472175 RepID=A0A084U5X0_9HYPH|nr:hypothetical protein [Nitratireductor basaltis]KFB08356.1 Manganese uptake regulator, Fur family [Nitratireductor basaltis]